MVHFVVSQSARGSGVFCGVSQCKTHCFILGYVTVHEAVVLLWYLTVQEAVVLFVVSHCRRKLCILWYLTAQEAVVHFVESQWSRQSSIFGYLTAYGIAPFCGISVHESLLHFVVPDRQRGSCAFCGLSQSKRHWFILGI